MGVATRLASCYPRQFYIDIRTRAISLTHNQLACFLSEHAKDILVCLCYSGDIQQYITYVLSKRGGLNIVSFSACLAREENGLLRKEEILMGEHKVVVITGGGEGIGESVTRRMAQDGYAVAILDYNINKAEALATDLRNLGFNVQAIYCDVSNPRDVDSAFDKVMEIFNRIDVLIHNAGMGGYLPWLDASLADWRKMFATNCTAVFLCGQRAAKEMVDSGIKGKIIITLSQASHTQDRDAVLYSVSKWGARGLMRNMAAALSSYGITVNGVCPGTVWTPMMEGFCKEHVDSGAGTKEQYLEFIKELYPLGRMQTGDDIAAMYSFLIREGHSISGQSLLVAGGIAFA
jgi:meso-butanediol dehydrogenase/(S,S)-butanediol dehydrogenase/diacetyl reductase